MVLLMIATYFPVLFMFFDVYYFLRAFVGYLYVKYIDKKRVSILTESTITGYCTTNDLDMMIHMNNARYLRECDFARFKLWIQNGVWDAKNKLGAYVTLGCSTIRYRKSLELGDKYVIKSKILCWDDDAFFVEQKIERVSDNFLCALVWIKQTFRKVTPSEIANYLNGKELPSPPFPKE